ncbi:cell wall-binding repeat-containing protein [Alkalihalobacillus sp. AL-G]|uniref:cell wall-binding repeat-containing protein n=1 Tax=Alkalihalobacillus sp. AL-G TaxID=2926399 RepID=UPI00272987EC|nr:cell wall-binding repeat-containing protein [Alkalihalobacillus sp. AL-G]WLD92995.1 cell wall-binding repeat-containing protein [Alkalihalobacillus sp. AL-G]
MRLFFSLSFFLIAFLLSSPSFALAQKYIIIDPGHGGDFSGTTGYSGGSTGYYEKHANLDVAEKLRDVLKGSDFKVFMTRDADNEDFGETQPDDLQNRMELANGFAAGNNEDTVFVSIHHNSAFNTMVRGYETFFFDINEGIDPNYPPDPMQIEFSPDSKRLAYTVHRHVVEGTSLAERYIKGQDLYVNRNAQMPSVLVELGYMSNPQEEQLIKTASAQQAAANAIVKALVEYFEVFEVYDHTGEKLLTTKSKDEALNYAKAREYVRVWDKDRQTNIYNTIEYHFDVIHASQGLLDEFVTKEEAIDYAMLWKHTKVVDDRTGEVLWAFPEEDTRILNVDELSGATRIETAIEISQDLYPNGFASDKQQKAVFLVTAYQYADALSAGPLAAKYGNAPILLTKSDKINDKVINELNRLNAEKIYIIGGAVAIDQSIEAQLKDKGFSVTRVNGKNRYETNLKINELLGAVNGVFVAAGRSFPDALSASSIASSNNWSIVLTEEDKMTNSSLQYLKGKNVVIAGGTAVVSGTVQNQITNAVGSQPLRLAGETRYDTLYEILNHFKDSISSDTVLVSTGTDFPDALASSTLSVKSKAPLIIASDELEPKLADFLETYKSENNVTDLKVIGGVVPNTVTGSVKALLN